MIKEIAEMFDDAVAREACRRFGFEHCKSVGGFESYVYKCRQDGHRFLRKITHTLRRTPEYIRGELEYVGYLADRGVPTSRAVEPRSGELVEAIDARRGQFLAYAFERSQGRHIEAVDWDPELISAWGRMMGRIHSLAVDFNPSSHAFRGSNGMGRRPFASSSTSRRRRRPCTTMPRRSSFDCTPCPTIPPHMG